MLTGIKGKYGSTLWRIILLAQAGLMQSAYANDAGGVVVGASAGMATSSMSDMAKVASMSSVDLAAIRHQHHMKVMADIPAAAHKMMARVEARNPQAAIVSSGLNLAAIAQHQHHMKVMADIPAAAQKMMDAIAMPVSLPEHSTIRAGDAQIRKYGHTMDIDLLTKKAVIDWDKFNIGKGNKVRVRQTPDSILLNTVTGSDMSVIAGLIQAKNGQVWLSNPNGITIADGVVNANLLATTKTITAENFLKDNFLFEESVAASADSRIKLEGNIVFGKGKWIQMLASHVEVNGSLLAAGSKQIILGGVQSFAVDFDGDGHTFLKVNEGAASHNVSVQIAKLAEIKATDGVVLLTTQDVKDTVAGVIKMDGIIEANRVTIDPNTGKIILKGGVGSTVTVDGRLSATGEGTKGGEVDVTGSSVKLSDSALIDVSGDQGGGSIAVGGKHLRVTPAELAAKEPFLRADHTAVSPGAKLKADAINEGDGGKVELWGTENLVFKGSASLRGGEKGGDGGTIELSAANKLDTHGKGTIDRSAPKGKAGNLIYDPNDIQIVSGNPGMVNFSWIATADLLVDLSNGDVTLSTVNNSGSAHFNTISTLVGARDTITLSSTLDLRGASGTHALILEAGNTIQFNWDLVLGNHNVYLRPVATQAANAGYAHPTFAELSSSISGGIIVVNPDRLNVSTGTGSVYLVNWPSNTYSVYKQSSMSTSQNNNITNVISGIAANAGRVTNFGPLGFSFPTSMNFSAPLVAPMGGSFAPLVIFGGPTGFAPVGGPSGENFHGPVGGPSGENFHGPAGGSAGFGSSGPTGPVASESSNTGKFTEISSASDTESKRNAGEHPAPNSSSDAGNSDVSTGGGAV